MLIFQNERRAEVITANSRGMQLHTGVTTIIYVWPRIMSFETGRTPLNGRARPPRCSGSYFRKSLVSLVRCWINEREFEINSIFYSNNGRLMK